MRTASGADIPEAAGVLADAFFDDPIQTWLLPDAERRTARLQRVFSHQLRHHLAELGATALATIPDSDRIASVAGWTPPSRWRPGLGAMSRIVLAYASTIGPRALGGLRLLRRIDHAHPKEPHWYLAVLGTAPAHQGRGHASAALQQVLERCDSEGVPAYLESSKEANVPFYERHGFRVTESIEVAGVPPVWLMWRDPGHARDE